MSEWKASLYVFVCQRERERQRERETGWVQLKYDGTRWRTGGDLKGKLANGVGSQYSSHYLGTWCIQHYYRWCAHLGCQIWRNWRPRQFKWTRPFRWKMKSGFCACAITFQTQSTATLRHIIDGEGKSYGNTADWRYSADYDTKSGRSLWPHRLRRGSAGARCWDCGFESQGDMDVCLLWLLCIIR